MPLSKGAIAGIVVGAVLVLAASIYCAVKYGPASTTKKKKYDCNTTSYTCGESDSGQYDSLSDCQNSCKAPPPPDNSKFSCDITTGTCSTDAKGSYNSMPDCQKACQTPNPPPPATLYACNDDGSCSVAPNGPYKAKSDCTAVCKPMKYSCNATTNLCGKDPNGQYATNTCDNRCVAPPSTTTYNCDSVQGCVPVTDGSTGKYPDGPTCQAKCKQLMCDPAKWTCTATTTHYNDLDTCAQGCVGGCSVYRNTNLPLSPGVDASLGTFTDTMSATYAMPLTNVRVTYVDPKNGNTATTGNRMVCYAGDWTDSGTKLFSQWSTSFGVDPAYSITGTPNVPFLYVPQLGTVPAITALGQKGLTYDPTKSYAQDARTLNGIPGVLIENLNTGKNYRVYMGQPPSLQASERFADNHFGYHNPSTAGSNLRNTFYWNFRERTDAETMDKAYVSASTDLYSSYKNPNSNTCFYYQANLVSTEALSAKLWPCGPAAPTDSLFVDFTASAPLNGQLGVISGSGFQAKGMDVPNKLTSQYASVLIKPNVDVGNGVKKNVCELRTYITWDSNSGAFKVVTTGGLITSKKWASGRYEIRAKVANRPAMVWAVWMFSAVYKLPSPMANCGSATCAACVNCTDYSTCCSLCSTATGSKCGTCGGTSGGTACSSDSDCSGSHCVIQPNPSQCNCQQCQSNPIPLNPTCSGYDCSKAIACGWDASKKQCTGSTSCSQYTSQEACNNSGPCQGQLSWKNSAPPVGIKTPWNTTTPQTPQNIYYVGTADINDPSSAGPQYQTAAAGSTAAGAILGGLPCSSYFNAEIDIEIPSNAPFFSGITTPTAPDTTRPTGHTMNMNTYRWTNSGGTGAYENLYTEAQQESDGTTPQFIGDGCYHTYTFEWHTGDPVKGIRPKVDYFFDGNYVGTSDAFVPDIFSRLWICSWDSGRPNGSWNGRLGANATVWSDVTELPTTTVAPQTGYVLYSVNYIDYIKVTPFNQANDKYLPDPLDQEYMNQLYDPSQVGMTPAGAKLPDGSGYKPASCCALVQQPSPYDGTTTVNQCVSYAYKSPPVTGVDWTNMQQYVCATPLNSSKGAPYIKSQTMVPFFQTQTPITTADGTQGYGVVWDAASNELTPPGPGPSNTCAGADVPCQTTANCVTYLTAQKCPASCTTNSYCRVDNNHCHISC